MDKFISKFEHAVMYLLIFVGLLFVVYQILDLLYVFFRAMYQCVISGQFLPEGGGLQIGAVFFNILLMMEIIETVKVFSRNHQNKIRIILLVGLIAVTRKILLLDFINAEPLEAVATSVMIIALSLGYYLISRADSRSLKTNNETGTVDEKPV